MSNDGLILECQGSTLLVAFHEADMTLIFKESILEMFDVPLTPTFFWELSPPPFGKKMCRLTVSPAKKKKSDDSCQGGMVQKGETY